MALTLKSHEYLLPPMIWSEFYHFRISGSIVCIQILHSFTDVMKVASPFGVWGQKYILLDRAPTPHERLSAIYIFNALFMDTPLAYLARHLTYTPNL